MKQHFPTVNSVAILLALAIGGISMSAKAQSPGSNVVSPRGDLTISVTPSRSGARFTRIALQTSGFAASNVTANELLKFAYGTKPYSLAGAPDWFATAKFDVQVIEPQADTASFSPTEIQEHRKLLVRTVLASAFQLKFHTVHTVVAGYSLVAGSTGAGITKHDSPDWSSARISNNDGHIEMTALPVSRFADELSDALGAPVVDRTGLSGTYDVSLWWDKSHSAGDAAGTYSVLASAMREQLGLELVPEQQDLERFVIDSIVPAGN